MTDLEVRNFDAVHVWLEGDNNDRVNITLIERLDDYRTDPDKALVIRIPQSQANYLANMLQTLLEYVNQPQQQEQRNTQA